MGRVVAFLSRETTGVQSRLDAAKTRQFDVVAEKDSEGFFVASVPMLPGCLIQARSLDELMARVPEAIELCLEVQVTIRRVSIS